MSAATIIQAAQRDRVGKGYARSLRRADKIPAVVYGHGYDPVSITVDGTVLNKMFKPGHEDQAEYQLYNLLIDKDGKQISKRVMIKAVQRHPLKQHIEHIDFFAVRMDEAIVAPVNIRLHGQPAGVKLGGILRHIIREVEVKGLPADIPPHIDLDIDHLEVGDSIHVSDLQITDTVQILTDMTAAVVNVIAPTVVKEDEEEALEEQEQQSATDEAPQD